MTRRLLVRCGVVTMLALPLVRIAYRNHATWIIPTLDVFLLSVAALAITSLLWLRADWRRLRPGWRLVPALVPLLALGVSIGVGRIIERVDFRLRRQAHYREVVEMVERHQIGADLDGKAFKMPPQYAADALWATANLYAPGQLRVEFRWTRSRSYVYCKEESCVGDSRWSSQRRLARDWLIVTR